MDAPFPALETGHEMPGKLQSAHHRVQRGWLPNFTTIRQTFTDGDERVLVHNPSPNSTESCTCFWSLAISPGFEGPPPEKQIEFAVNVLDEDRRMCEMQMPREVPVNPERGGWGVLVTPGDTLANTFQRQLRRWLLAQAGFGELEISSDRILRCGSACLRSAGIPRRACGRDRRRRRSDRPIIRPKRRCGQAFGVVKIT